MARPAGFEPATIRLEGGCSIQLSYGRTAYCQLGNGVSPRLKAFFRLIFHQISIWLTLAGSILRNRAKARNSGRSGGIRTPDPLVPNQMRYQAALHSDLSFCHVAKEVRILPMLPQLVNGFFEKKSQLHQVVKPFDIASGKIA